MNVVAIIQARTGSTRLPSKIFLDLCGNSLLFHVIDRLKPSKFINKIVVATTTASNDDKIQDWAIDNNVDCFRGSEENVLERYYFAAKKFNANIVVRITADDPFKDYRMIDNAIMILKDGNYDFVCNNNPVSYPEGLDVEVISMDALCQSYAKSTSKFEQEHVTQYIHKNKDKFKIYNLKNDKDLSYYRWTIDTKEDYIFTKEIYNFLYKKDRMFLTEDVYRLLEIEPNLLKINNEVKKSDLYK